MFYFLLAKVIRCALTLLLVVTFVFIMLRSVGDPTRALLPDDTPAQTVKTYRERWGLDKPIAVQYWIYIKNVMRGDFGRSFRDGREALVVVKDRISATLILGMTALGLALILGIPVGISAALRPSTWIDRLLMSMVALGHSVPPFFLGVVLILVFCVTLRWLPSWGDTTPVHLILPAITLGLWNAATLARFTRGAMIDALSQPYMRTAIASGLSRLTQVLKHALPNAAIPILTVLGSLTGNLLSGGVIVETVFGWPGIGRLLVTAVVARELAIIQVIVVLCAAAMVTSSLVVDLLCVWIDPRILLAETRN